MNDRLVAVVVGSFFLSPVFGSLYSNTWLVKGNINKTEMEGIAAKHGFIVIDKLLTGQYLLKRMGLSNASNISADSHTSVLGTYLQVHYIEQEEWTDVTLDQPVPVSVTDPMWKQSWYLNDNSSNLSMGVLEAWNSGFTGLGISIGIVDDGVDYTHDDLVNKTVTLSSLKLFSVTKVTKKMRGNTNDFANSHDFYDDDTDPTPVSNSSHGTNCAGVALAEKNNRCGLGSAYDATLVAIRMIGHNGALPSGKIRSLTQGGVDIFSNSWGNTEGTFQGPTPDEVDAMYKGVTKLRRGKGVIYLFAGGNGGPDDNCNTDGYVNSIYTIAINGVDRTHTPPSYAESCSAILASAYSGSGADGLFTTYRNNECNNTFTGTSAATPLAAGVLALVLQANPELHWRDIQELIVMTSNLDGLLSAKANRNGAGLKYSPWYGYGLLNATKLITTAQNWTSLTEQHTCSTNLKTVGQFIDHNQSNRTILSLLTINGCNDTGNCVNRIEHVTVYADFASSKQGMITISLESPSGTVSDLLTARKIDKVNNSVQKWTFTSVQFWGESPSGTWKLNFSVESLSETGTLKNWKLTLYGTGDNCLNKTQATSTTPIGIIVGSSVAADNNQHNPTLFTDVGTQTTPCARITDCTGLGQATDLHTRIINHTGVNEIASNESGNTGNEKRQGLVAVYVVVPPLIVLGFVAAYLIYRQYCKNCRSNISVSPHRQQESPMDLNMNQKYH